MSKEYMKNPIGDRFDGRLKTASQAKQKQLERFKVAASDPDMQAKRAERQAVAAAQKAQRKATAAKLLREKESFERQKTEVAELEAAQSAAREVELEAERAGAAEREITQEAASKAERDRRYAARRNRKR